MKDKETSNFFIHTWVPKLTVPYLMKLAASTWSLVKFKLVEQYSCVNGVTIPMSASEQEIPFWNSPMASKKRCQANGEPVKGKGRADWHEVEPEQGMQVRAWE